MVKVYAKGEYTELGYYNNRYIKIDTFGKYHKKSHVIVRNSFKLKRRIWPPAIVYTIQ